MTENDNVPGRRSDAPDQPGHAGSAAASGQPHTPEGQQSTSVYPAGYQPYGSTEQYQPVAAPTGYAAPSYQGQYGYNAPTYGHAYGQQPSYPTYSSYGSQPGYAQESTGTSVATDADETSRPGRGRSLVVASVAAALIGGGVGGGIVAVADRHNNGGTVNTGLKITNSTGAPAAQTNGTIGAAAAKIRPSVVTIDVSGTTESGTGSGVIIRTDGYILTNNHVVAIGGQSAQIEVTLADGRTAAGRIVGQDPSDDLAVVKVDGLSDLTAATFAKSSELTVGQSVVAVGAPLGLSDTVTAGIVSNTARPVRTGGSNTQGDPGAVFQAIQTDAAINPGNSGGPLVDLNGSVVGINSAIASDTSSQSGEAGNIGIGFAIPSDEASRIAGELIAQGKAYHAVIGVSVPGNDDSNAKGVKVIGVSSGGPGDSAGIKTGDLITAIDGNKVRTGNALIAAVRSHAPGEQVKITFTRGSGSQTVTVTLGKSDS